MTDNKFYRTSKQFQRGDSNTIRHLSEQLESTRIKSANRRRALKTAIQAYDRLRLLHDKTLKELRSLEKKKDSND